MKIHNKGIVGSSLAGHNDKLRRKNATGTPSRVSKIEYGMQLQSVSIWICFPYTYATGAVYTWYDHKTYPMLCHDSAMPGVD